MGHIVLRPRISARRFKASPQIISEDLCYTPWVSPPRGIRQALVFLLLVLSGEAIFALPFHVARFFRPSLLAALHLSNGELGAMQSAYGFVALLSYFPGGVLADRFAARTLLAASLCATALGGL